MNIRRLRLLAGLVQESVSTNPEVNQHIEKVLAEFAPSEQTELLDALEIVQRSGEQGVSITDWGQQLAQLYAGSSINLKGLLQLVQDRFTFCVKPEQRRLVWIEDQILAPASAPAQVEPAETPEAPARPSGGLMRDLANAKLG